MHPLPQLNRLCRTTCAAMALLWLAACATAPITDYSALQARPPKSILVLPPTNESADVRATPSVLAQATYPLAEGGYYVMPVTLVSEMFKQNGMTLPEQMHATPIDKLQSIFGADAVLYISIQKYGTSYQVINSVTQTKASAKLVDLKTGQTLWTGNAYASNQEGQSHNQGGLAGLLVAAIVKQVMANVLDESHAVAGVATQRLLGAGGNNQLLHGPRSPLFSGQASATATATTKP